ncbi:MAG: glycosyltransferase, partial [Clostridia bacterium]|nr:glycosyltransferase [Clostridia bacterium]
QAGAAGIEQVVRDMGRMDRGQVLSLQQQADVLLMASWNTKERIGVLTGKLPEYMMMGKPVICCVAGDLPGSEVRRVLEDNMLGFCWEQPCAERDTPALEEYLREIIHRARQGRPIGPEQGTAAVEQYAYPQIAGEFNSWIEEMCR